MTRVVATIGHLQWTSLMEIESLLRTPDDISLQPRTSANPVPLSAPQLRWWRALQRDNRQGARTMATAMHISGNLDVDVLRESVDAVVCRHESLRTRIVVVDETPMQWVDPAVPLPLDRMDLSRESTSDDQSRARCCAERLIAEKVDLAVGPLFKATLIDMPDLQHVLVLMADHIVSDAASLAIVNSEIWTLYSGRLLASRASLPPLRIQFGDYAVWQHQTFAAWRAHHEEYWRRHLAGAPRVQLPVDHPFDRQQAATAVAHIPFGKRLTGQLREIARLEQSPLALVALTLHVCAMSCWCDQRSLLVTFVTHGRHHHADLKTMTGFLASSLLLRVHVGASDSFLDLLRQIRSEFDSAFEHYDFGHVANLLPDCSTDLCFNWLPNKAAPGRSANYEQHSAAPRIRPFRLGAAWPGKFWPFFSDSPAGISVSAMYRPDLFATPTIDHFGKMLRAFGQAFGRDPLTRMSSAA